MIGWFFGTFFANLVWHTCFDSFFQNKLKLWITSYLLKIKVSQTKRNEEWGDDF